MAKNTISKKLKYTLNSLLVALGISVTAHSCASILKDDKHDETRIEIESEQTTDSFDEILGTLESESHEHDKDDNVDSSEETNESDINVDESYESTDSVDESIETETNESDINVDESVSKNESVEDSEGNNETETNESESKSDNKVEKHEHVYTEWTYFDKEKEFCYCEDCGHQEFRNHKLNLYSKVETNNNKKHEIIDSYKCETCSYENENKKVENCNLGEWKYNSQTGKEEKECSVCDYKEIKEHKHQKAPSNLIYTLDISNEDGTHKLKATYNCNVCSQPITLYKTKNCSFNGWEYNHHTEQEERKCYVCDYKEIKEHKHQSAPSNLVYTLDISNQNGTHKLKATYDCNKCNQSITLYKTENCSLGEWKYNSQTGKEEKKCSVCDYKKTQEHKHQSAPNNLVYTLDISNEDGTHKIKATYNCNVCSQPITLYKTENCSLGEWKYNNQTGKEERKCSVCDYKEIKEHKHQSAPSNLVYTLDISNEDGTHKLKATYNCNVCSQPITLYKTENCSYGSWTKNNENSCIKNCEICDYEVIKTHSFIVVPNSVTSNTIVGLHNVLEKCDDCSYERQVTVSCTGDGNKYFYQDGNIVTERENCEICGDVCIEDPHNHTYGNYISIDDSEHKRQCACGNESIEAHDYSSWVVTGDGTNTRTCNDCDHTESVTHTCSLDEKTVLCGTADCCYEIVTTCLIDGCTYESRVPVGHNYQVESNMFGSIYTCYTCGHSYEQAAMSLFSVNNEYSDDNINCEEHQCDAKQLVLR